MRRNSIGLPDKQHFDVFVCGEKLDRCRDRHGNAVIATHAVDGKLDGHASLMCGFTCFRPMARAHGTQLGAQFGTRFAGPRSAKKRQIGLPLFCLHHEPVRSDQPNALARRLANRISRSWS
uniref:Uncharacterized protein n=1 Tax=blood disease bacterium R229 TaxID=741978 RepID=G2ZVB8_9RALS|nr:conserved hypothetical protein [blood disease bacterium R229]